MEQTVTIPGLKLGACLNMPTRRMLKLLAEASADSNRARNAMIRAWVRWREDNPDWTPGQRTKDGVPLVAPDGKPKMEDDAGLLAEGIQKMMRDAGKKVSPNLAAKLNVSCQRDVARKLTANMPYTHTGKARKVWQAILMYEMSCPCWRGNDIHVPTQDAAFCYMGDYTGMPSPGVRADCIRCGTDSAVLRFALLRVTPTARLRDRSVGSKSASNRARSASCCAASPAARSAWVIQGWPWMTADSGCSS